SACSHSSSGALARAAESIPGSASRPTTSRPRRASSMATRPVPQPASSTERTPSPSTNVASPCMSIPAAAMAAKRPSHSRPRASSETPQGPGASGGSGLSAALPGIGLEVEGQRVDAVPQAGGVGAVVEDVAQVPAAALAPDFGAGHEVALVDHTLDVLL